MHTFPCKLCTTLPTAAPRPTQLPFPHTPGALLLTTEFGRTHAHSTLQTLRRRRQG